ncbi:MAG: hypothetical protein FJ083_14155 [Cyanobacteria bacterium K_Offshore_surface_m2_239]|nr:hypothetical protein [Cyanobacteria bacterium K_Offshore_surface_m2_239]
MFKARIRNKGKTNERREWSIALEGHREEDDVKQFASSLWAEFQRLNPGARPGKNGLPYYEAQDETGMATGVIIFNFSRRQLRGNGTPNVPPFVQDAQGNPWPSDVLIGNGSIVKVAFTVWKWNPNGEGGAGIGLELEGVRVIVHSEYVAPPPADYSGAFGGPEPGHVLNGTERRALPYSQHEDDGMTRAISREEIQALREDLQALAQGAVAAPPVTRPPGPVRPAPSPSPSRQAFAATPNAPGWAGQYRQDESQWDSGDSEEIPLLF